MYIDNIRAMDIAAGKDPLRQVSFKFGEGLIGTSLTTVWSGAAEQPGLYIRPSLSGETLYVSSVSIEDNPAGTGAFSVLLEGHDTNNMILTEVVELNGQTQVPTVNLFTRVCRMYVLTAATDAGALGEIYVGTSGATGGIPTGTIYAKIENGALQTNQTQMSCFTVPRGHILYLWSYEFSEVADNKVVDLGFYTRDFGNNGVWRRRSNTRAKGGIYNNDLPIPLVVPELHDIEVRGKTNTNTDLVTASYLYILEKI